MGSYLLKEGVGWHTETDPETGELITYKGGDWIECDRDLREEHPNKFEEGQKFAPPPRKKKVAAKPVVEESSDDEDEDNTANTENTPPSAIGTDVTKNFPQASVTGCYVFENMEGWKVFADKGGLKPVSPVMNTKKAVKKFVATYEPPGEDEE